MWSICFTREGEPKERVLRNLRGFLSAMFIAAKHQTLFACLVLSFEASDGWKNPHPYDYAIENKCAKPTCKHRDVVCDLHTVDHNEQRVISYCRPHVSPCFMSTEKSIDR